jgi:hypothetical protein
MKKTKSSKGRVRRYTVTLSECEVLRLTRFADSANIDRPTALHRLLSQSLREATAGLAADAKHDENQLGLFDSVQLDIFNNTHKVAKD